MKKILCIVLPMLFFMLVFNACEKESCSEPCLNGGVCINGSCECPIGYGGINCQDTVDPCADILCFNGGICDNGQCDCPPGYTGTDCAVSLNPVSMTIERIEVTDYPTVQPNGSGWDISDGADPFVTFNPGSNANKNDFVSQHYTNVTGQDLSYTSNLPITISNLNINWTLALWDYDATSGDDIMVQVSFSPINSSNGFPTFIRINTSDFSAIVYVTWNF